MSDDVAKMRDDVVRTMSRLTAQEFGAFIEERGFTLIREFNAIKGCAEYRCMDWRGNCCGDTIFDAVAGKVLANRIIGIETYKEP